MQQSGHTRAGPAPQGQPGCELTVWSSQVVVATVMFAGLSRGVLHPQMTGCEELPLVVAASVLGMQTQCGSTQGLWLATRRLPGHYVPVEYGDCWDQWSVGDKWVSPSWGETALVWWHATGQVLMFLHNVFVPGYWLLILEFGKWPVPGWRVQWVTGHHTAQVRAGSCDVGVACWPVTQGGLMGFRPWGIVWALRASLLIEHQPLMG